MDGLLIIDKPAGMTSHDVVSRVRRILGTRRVGHTGTLDPFATGVMVILVGHATRLAQFLDKDEKEYEALVQLGSETDTGDRTGSGSSDCGLGIGELQTKLDAVDWDEVFSSFRGEILQTPPMYSAKKVEGRKLYELARKGIEVERKPVKVYIRSLELQGSEAGDPDASRRIRVSCSAGTYIRTLAEEIGRTIGTGAHLLELRRTRSGRFDLRDAIELSKLEQLRDPASRLRPADEAVMHLPAVTLTADRSEKTKSGLATRTDDETLADGESIRMLDPDSSLIAVGRYNAEEKSVKPKIVLV